MARPYSGPDTDLVPQGADMAGFLSWWFEKTTRGVIEIGWLDAAGRGLIHFEQFARDDIQSACATAAQANIVPGQAVYVRAATVMPRVIPGSYTTDMDFEQAPGIWGDIDTKEQFEHAKTVQTIVRPNACVITGIIPHTRVQSWFRASEPIASPDLLRSLNVRLHRLYGGDPAVVNPTRLMRLPGTIAWPWKSGRVPELTLFVRPVPDDKRPSFYPLSLFASQLPQDEQPPAIVNGTQSIAPGAFGLPGAGSTVSGHIAQIRSGHEWHNSVIRLVAHWVGRGWSSVEIQTACEAFTQPGYTHEQTRREVAKAIEGARHKWAAPDVDPDMSGAQAVKRPSILSLADLDALPAPTWLVHGLVPEQSLVVPYGPPKAGKTFVILSMALHIAAGRPWFDRPVQAGAVVYIAGEGVGGLSMRLRAMRDKYAIGVDVPFWVVPRAVNFRLPAEVNALESIIRETVGTAQVRLVVIDTLARAMPGADENSAQEVGAVIAAADYIKDALRCTVALIHHEGKDGERGARGTSALRGAWDAAYRITIEGNRTVMAVIDQKDAEAGQKLSFVMEEVAVGIGRNSLVPMLDDTALPEDAGGQRERRGIGGHAGLVLQTLRNLMAGPDAAILPPLSGMPSGDVMGVSDAALRRAVYEKMPGVEPGTRRQAYHRSVQTLMERGLINVKEPWIWLC